MTTDSLLTPQLLALYASYRLMTDLSPASADRRKSSRKGKETLARLRSGGKRLDDLGELNEYEEVMLAEVVHPEDLEVGFDGESC